MMSASGFQVARIPPLMGRPLLETDEVPGAPPVVVLGYDQWLRRFGGDPDIIGRTVRIDLELHTVVGVMPKDYGFPLSAALWLPFKDDPADYAVMETPYGYYVFGRLAPGVTIAAAQAEVTVIANRRASDLPETHEHLQAMENIFSNLQKDTFRRFLRQATDVPAVLDLIHDADTQQLQG